MTAFTAKIDNQKKEQSFHLTLEDILNGEGGVYEVENDSEVRIIVFPGDEIYALYICGNIIEHLDYSSWKSNLFRLTDLNVEIVLK
jgi:hypothetical protein